MYSTRTYKRCLRLVEHAKEQLGAKTSKALNHARESVRQAHDWESLLVIGGESLRVADMTSKLISSLVEPDVPLADPVWLRNVVAVIGPEIRPLNVLFGEMALVRSYPAMRLMIDELDPRPADLNRAFFNLRTLVWSNKESARAAEKMFRLLIRGGADIDGRNDRGETLLIEAAKYPGNARLCELLLRNGADVNAKAHDRSTALHVAESNSLRVLLRFNPDLEARNDADLTPIIEMVARNSVNEVEQLRQAGARLDVRCRWKGLEHFVRGTTMRVLLSREMVASINLSARLAAERHNAGMERLLRDAAKRPTP